MSDQRNHEWGLPEIILLIAVITMMIESIIDHVRS